MDVVILTVFVSLCLVACGLLLLGVTLRARSHEHSARLSLLPLDDAESPPRPHDSTGVH